MERPTHRQRQAMHTRAEVARAARALFAEHGYVATTIAGIARAADIPAPTIYSAFGGKAAILREVAAQAVRPLEVDRTHREATALDDPAESLRVLARLQRDQFESMFDVIVVYQEAARADEEIAADLRTIMTNRERAFARHMTSLEAHLRPGLTSEDATAVYLAMVLPEIYRTLVAERRWAPDRYERWLADQLIAQLLRS